MEQLPAVVLIDRRYIKVFLRLVQVLYRDGGGELVANSNQVTRNFTIRQLIFVRKRLHFHEAV